MLDVIVALFQWACLVDTPNEARDKREALLLTERQRRVRGVVRRVFFWLMAVPAAFVFIFMIACWVR